MSFKKQINQLVGGLETIHTSLRLKNCYLPELKSSVITCDYLLNIALSKYFRMETSKVKFGQLFKKVSKIQLRNELEKVCNSRNIELGITAEKLPEKNWLINALQTLDEENAIFKTYIDHENVVGITRDDLNSSFAFLMFTLVLKMNKITTSSDKDIDFIINQCESPDSIIILFDLPFDNICRLKNSFSFPKEILRDIGMILYSIKNITYGKQKQIYSLQIQIAGPQKL